MGSRDRVLTTMGRKIPDRVPKNMRCSPHIFEVFQKKTGKNSIEDYFNFDIRFVNYKAQEEKKDFSKYYPDKLPEGAYMDSWGVVRFKGSFYHFQKAIHPMERFTSSKEIEEYPFPEFIPKIEEMKKDVEKVKKRDLCAISNYENGCFEQAINCLRGTENFLVDMIGNPEFAYALLERILEVKVKKAEGFVKAGVDILWIGDDIGMQNGMLISLDIWRKFLKLCLSKIVRTSKAINPDVLVAYHSCGYCEPIIPELIEIGIDILEPVQPECMDPASIKRKFGNNLSFWGTIGTQSTLPHGNPIDVKKEVKDRISTVGKGGGLLISPSHVVEPEVPWENILAFFEAVEEFGKY